MTRLHIIAGLSAASLLLGGFLLDTRNDAAEIQAKLTACTEAREALVKQSRETATKEGARYERTEAAALADCRDAYSAGARVGGVSDAEAVAAGRYVPRPSVGRPAG